MSDDKALPHCPRCGHARQPLWGFCSQCHFNAGYGPGGMGWVAVGPWEQAVRAELARQALEMRAHAHYTRPSKYDGAPISDWPGPDRARSAVLSYYEWLGKNPIRLPGDPA